MSDNNKISTDEANAQAGTAWAMGFLFGGLLVGAAGVAVANTLADERRQVEARLRREESETSRLQARLQMAERDLRNAERERTASDREAKRETYKARRLKAANRFLKDKVSTADQIKATSIEAGTSAGSYADALDVLFDATYGL